MPSIIRATTTNGLQIAPDNSGSLQLQTNGTTTALTIDTSQNATFAGTLTATGKLASSSMPTGSVLQVVSTTKTDTFSTTSTTFTDVTGLSVTITPTSSSNQILVLVGITGIGTDVATAGATGYVLLALVNTVPLVVGKVSVVVPETEGDSIEIEPDVAPFNMSFAISYYPLDI